MRHYETLKVETGILRAPTKVTVVDDIVTKGATPIAAASRIQDEFPLATVRAFALIRTMGFVPEIERVGSPCVGRISTNGSDVRREP